MIEPGLKWQIEPGLKWWIKPGLKWRIEPGLKWWIEPGLKWQIEPGLKYMIQLAHFRQACVWQLPRLFIGLYEVAKYAKSSFKARN